MFEDEALGTKVSGISFPVRKTVHLICAGRLKFVQPEKKKIVMIK